MTVQEITAVAHTAFAYRVAGTCDGCRLCAFLAVNNFARIGNGPRHRVVKQPENWEEREQCLEAYERCPYHGIERTAGGTSASSIHHG